MYLGPFHPLTKTFQENFEAAKAKINKTPSNFRINHTSMKERLQSRLESIRV